MARSPSHSGTRKTEVDHDIHPPISDGDPMSWLSKLMPKRIRTQGGDKRKVPEGLWGKCEGCGAVLYQPELEANLQVCPKCSFHMPIGARERLKLFLDEGTGTEIGAELAPADALKFKDSKKYKDRLVAAQKLTGETDALVALHGRLKGQPVAACAFEFAFMAGSMGSVVGERFTLAAEHCLAHGMPLVCFSAAGGADKALHCCREIGHSACINWFTDERPIGRRPGAHGFLGSLAGAIDPGASRAY